jgi:large subunit ribosomal protein L25
MSKSLNITATKRDELGKGAARRLRRENLIPVVAYGHGADAISMTISNEDCQRVLLHSGIVELNCNDSDKKTTVLKTVQRHPISNQILHIDFQIVRADEIIATVVPVISVGEPIGLQQGGQLEQVMMDIEVKSLPMDIPEFIQGDVSELDMDEALHVRALIMPEGVSTDVDPDQVVFNVRTPRVQIIDEELEAEGEEGEIEGEEGEEGETQETQESDSE